MKRINIFVLLCIFIFTMTAGAWAATTGVNVGNATYATLKAAIDDFNKGDSADATIVLNDNIALNEKIEIKPLTNTQNGNTKGTGKLTINLSGHDIDGKTYELDISSGDVIITGTGTISSTGKYRVILLGDITDNDSGFASLTVNNGVTITSGKSDGIVVAGKNHKLDSNNHGQKLIFNGTIRINADKNGICNFYNNDTTYYDSTDIEIGSGAVIVVNAPNGKGAGIFHPSSGDLKILGGTIEAPTAIEIHRGKATISGGTFTSNLLTTADPNPTTLKRYTTGVLRDVDNSTSGTGKNLTAGYSVASVQDDDLHNAANITITGGQFKGYIEILDVNDSKVPAKESSITVTGGQFSSDDVKFYVPSGTSVTKQGDWYVVGTASTTPTTPKEVTATVSSTGNLTYTVTPAGQTATLAEVLDKVAAADKSKITTLTLNSSISSLTASDLASLTSLKSLAVESTSSVSTVDLSSNTTITEFKAPNASKLTNLTVKGNKTIQTLDVSGSGLTTLDASNCSALKTVNAKGGKLESVNFTGTKLTDLNVSGNKLTQLDLTGQTLAASKANFGGQATTKSYTLAKEMNFAQLMGLSSLKAKIKAIYEILNGIEIQSGYYDTDDGTVTFDETPKNSLTYYYDTGVTISSSSNKADEASLAAGESAAYAYMDVTVSGGTAAGEEKEEEEATTASSSSGCEAGLGLGALAALAIFAKKR